MNYLKVSLRLHMAPIDLGCVHAGMHISSAAKSGTVGRVQDQPVAH